MSLTKKWYTDNGARKLHYELQQELKPILAKLCPAHELSHAGINRNEITEEITLVLHLNPLGRVRVVSDPYLAHILNQEETK